MADSGCSARNLPRSLSGLLIGVVVSIVMGWIAAAVMVSVYNAALRR